MQRAPDFTAGESCVRFVGSPPRFVSPEVNDGVELRVVSAYPVKVDLEQVTRLNLSGP
jgi:hypothetical protein